MAGEKEKAARKKVKVKKVECWVCNKELSETFVLKHGIKQHPGEGFKCKNIHYEYAEMEGKQYNCTGKIYYNAELIKKHQKSDKRIPKRQPKFKAEDKE